MIYVKQVINDQIIALLTYNYTPKLDNDQSLIIITEKEYKTLVESLQTTKTIDTDLQTETDKTEEVVLE